MQHLPTIATLSTRKDLVSSQLKRPLEKKIGGQVRNAANDETLPCVSIVVKDNNKIGTITDTDGNFSLAVPDDAKYLVLSYIGFQTQEIEINNRKGQ